MWSVRKKRKKDASLSLKIYGLETSLMVLWLRLYTSIAGDVGSVPGWRTKIPPAMQCGQKFSFKKKIFVLSHQKKMDLPSTEKEKAESLPSRTEYSSWEDKTDIFSEIIRLK